MSFGPYVTRCTDQSAKGLVCDVECYLGDGRRGPPLCGRDSVCATPLSAFRAYIHTETHARTHAYNQPSASSSWQPPSLRLPSIDDTPTHTRAHVSASSFSTVRDRRRTSPSTDTTTANIEFALTSREHVGRSIRFVWYPRNFTGGYEGKLDARRRLFSRTRADKKPLAVWMWDGECSLLWLWQRIEYMRNGMV